LEATALTARCGSSGDGRIIKIAPGRSIAVAVAIVVGYDECLLRRAPSFSALGCFCRSRGVDGMAKRWIRPLVQLLGGIGINSRCEEGG